MSQRVRTRPDRPTLKRHKCRTPFAPAPSRGPHAPSRVAGCAPIQPRDSAPRSWKFLTLARYPGFPRGRGKPHPRAGALPIPSVNPNGIPASSPRLLGTSYPGYWSGKSSTPTGLRPVSSTEPPVGRVCPQRAAAPYDHPTGALRTDAPYPPAPPSPSPREARAGRDVSRAGERGIPARPPNGRARG